MKYVLDHLDHLESEAIYIFREAVSQLENCALLFSGGKDSIVMAHLAKKAFWPAKVPFKFMHVDTGHNFKETIEFRDKFMKDNEFELIVRSVEDSIKNGRCSDAPSRNRLQSITLMDAIEEFKFDALFGGARRDEEKARAKERFFSHRDSFGEWDPKNQRPEVWSLFNLKKETDEHFRVFPLSNWTELDVWEYIKRENIELPSIYFSHEREVFERGGVIYANADFLDVKEKVESKIVRFRTIGDITCTGAVESKASSIDEVISEIKASRVTERGTRADDKTSETAMEDRKKEGYF